MFVWWWYPICYLGCLGLFLDRWMPFGETQHGYHPPGHCMPASHPSALHGGLFRLFTRACAPCPQPPMRANGIPPTPVVCRFGLSRAYGSRETARPTQIIRSVAFLFHASCNSRRSTASVPDGSVVVLPFFARPGAGSGWPSADSAARHWRLRLRRASCSCLLRALGASSSEGDRKGWV